MVEPDCFIEIHRKRLATQLILETGIVNVMDTGEKDSFLTCTFPKCKNLCNLLMIWLNMILWYYSG